jgi:hypothetical protein
MDDITVVPIQHSKEFEINFKAWLDALSTIGLDLEHMTRHVSGVHS